MTAIILLNEKIDKKNILYCIQILNSQSILFSKGMINLIQIQVDEQQLMEYYVTEINKRLDFLEKELTF